MKRFVSVCICVLIVVAMAVPAFAVTDMPELKAMAQSIKADVIAFSGYPYAIIFYNGASQYIAAVFKTKDNFSDYKYLQYDSSGKRLSTKMQTGSGAIRIQSNAFVINTTVIGYFISDASDFTPSNFSTLDITWDYEILVGIVDFEALKEVIRVAKEKADTGYSIPTWQALQNLIAQSESMVAEDISSQVAIDLQVLALQSAIDGLVLLPDSSELQSLIAEASGYESAKYSAVSFSRLQTAVSAAKSLLASGDYTSAQIDAATIELQNAISGLQPEEKPTINAEMIAPVLELTVANFAVILPIACLLFGVAFGTFIIPRIVRIFTKG